jgi:gas vesicle protein
MQGNKEKNAKFKDIQNTTEEIFLSIEKLKKRISNKYDNLNIADNKIADWLTNQKKDINDKVNKIKDYPNQNTIYSKN